MRNPPLYFELKNLNFNNSMFMLNFIQLCMLCYECWWSLKITLQYTFSIKSILRYDSNLPLTRKKSDTSGKNSFYFINRSFISTSIYANSFIDSIINRDRCNRKALYYAIWLFVTTVERWFVWGGKITKPPKPHQASLF